MIQCVDQAIVSWIAGFGGIELIVVEVDIDLVFGLRQDARSWIAGDGLRNDRDDLGSELQFKPEREIRPIVNAVVSRIAK